MHTLINKEYFIMTKKIEKTRKFNKPVREGM